MQHEGYNFAVNGREHNYDYLGQERQEELGLNWLTFRHRNYNPEIGRFFGVDPVSSEYMSISTYQFAHNNPVWKIEIEGLEGKPINLPDIINHEPVLVMGSISGSGYHAYPDKRTQRADMVMTAFDNNLAKRLVSHYAHGRGQSVSISESQMMQTNPHPVSIRRGAMRDSRKAEASRFDKELGSLKPGESKQITQSVSGKTRSHGTLGRFSVMFEGTLSKDGEDGSKWTFNGTMQFIDVWDFDKKKDGVRSKDSELFTKVGREFLVGDGFRIISDKINVSQSSSEGQVNWWNGKKFKDDPSSFVEWLNRNPKIKKALSKLF